ncbi:MAG: response regulator [Candidatus Marsarchaeota archaeon]|jgi:DNA-binding response OmpR family regulator|nr:response regulator [Candidatus Marsarchaeota archaeon]
MKSLEDSESDIISVLNDRQEITYNELKSFAAESGIEDDTLKKSLKELEKANAIASRSSGGILTYYMLQQKPLLRRIMIVEDDKSINNLMAFTIGGDFDITQMNDGEQAMRKIKMEKPDLVVLDLNLPGMDGLEICKRIKKDALLKDTIVIIVSAMDATSNRFKGIKYGADYYIRKPFEPSELRSLVKIFLKKKGKKFDPLIDLPNQEKISDTVEKALKATEKDYEIGRLRVEGISKFVVRFGNESGITILRLVSQLLQDKVKDSTIKMFVGFLDGEDFIVAGERHAVEHAITSIKSEFTAVLPFVYQSEGYKPMELGIDSTYGAEKPMLNLVYSQIEKSVIIERRAEVLKNKEDKEGKNKDVGNYTYDELRHMLGSEDLNITITRDPNGVRLSVGKGNDEKEDK